MRLVKINFHDSHEFKRKKSRSTLSLPVASVGEWSDDESWGVTQIFVSIFEIRVNHFHMNN